MALKLADFDYDLPPELIAQYPPAERTASRMLVVERATGRTTVAGFADFPGHIQAGDCLVRNDTRVIPARLRGRRKPTGGRVEALLLEEHSPGQWTCMMKPGRRIRAGENIVLADAQDQDACLHVLGRREDGTFDIKLGGRDPGDFLERYGEVPLPPYIEREADEADRNRYQTVYAQRPGAVAAPTAGLHFTPAVLERLADKGVEQATVTLHVGPGTFRPVKEDAVEKHRMHEERYELPPDTAEKINLTRRNGGRVFAVGTTTVRVLETCANPENGTVIPGAGRTRLFMHPPMTPVVCDALLTNFHLPRSTLLMLVSTFSTVDRVLAAYRTAIRQRFRFYSYGDCMLLV